MPSNQINTRSTLQRRRSKCLVGKEVGTIGDDHEVRRHRHVQLVPRRVVLTSFSEPTADAFFLIKRPPRREINSS